VVNNDVPVSTARTRGAAAPPIRVNTAMPQQARNVQGTSPASNSASRGAGSRACAVRRRAPAWRSCCHTRWHRRPDVATPLINDGRLRANCRHQQGAQPDMPDVPTLAESGHPISRATVSSASWCRPHAERGDRALEPRDRRDLSKPEMKNGRPRSAMTSSRVRRKNSASGSGLSWRSGRVSSSGEHQGG